MTLHLGSVVLRVADSGRGRAFWSAALGFTGAPHDPDFLVPPASAASAGAPGPTRLHLDDEDRTHLDLWVGEDGSLAEEVERLLGLGATRVEWELPADAEHVVLADPEGNLFCVCG